MLIKFSHAHNYLGLVRRAGRQSHGRIPGALSLMRLPARMQDVSWAQVPFWDLAAWFYGIPALIFALIYDLQVRHCTMSAAKSSRSKQLVTSCLPRMSLHHGENCAAQFCWHTPPLKKHDHREPRLTSIFWPQSMSPCQNNRHLTQSNWQLSDSLCALFQGLSIWGVTGLK